MLRAMICKKERQLSTLKKQWPLRKKRLTTLDEHLRNWTPGFCDSFMSNTSATLTISSSENSPKTIPFGQMPSTFNKTRLEELLKKRFFFAPSYQIYGGVAGLYDYGPSGCALQVNILDLWRRHFALEEGMLEIDSSILTMHDVLKASGHIEKFTDFMAKDLVTGDFYRVDHLLEDRLAKVINALSPNETEKKKELEIIVNQLDALEEHELQALIDKHSCLSDQGNTLGPVHKFNLMFQTSIGPTSNSPAFLRPETAQGMFTNFKRLLETNMDRMPFAAAQIGKSFRNEISPRGGLLRVREFTMAEIEHFVHPDRKDHKSFWKVSSLSLPLLCASSQLEGSKVPKMMLLSSAVETGMINNETLAYFMARIYLFLIKLGIDPSRLRLRQHLKNEMAHYACDCWDAEILTSYGWIECVGCADRSAYDLTQHQLATKEKLVVRERLEVPLKRRIKRLEINKKELGIAFKKDAKEISEILQAMSLDDVEHLLNNKNDNERSISLNDSSKVTLMSGMASVIEEDETLHVLEYVPSVIEPSFGIGRIIYALLEHSFEIRTNVIGGDDKEDIDAQRCILSLPAAIAPIKVLIAPLSNNEAFKPYIGSIIKNLRLRELSCQVDDGSTSIGRRYARNDEIGIPYGITIDFQTAKDQTITLRERDSCEQVRIKIRDVARVIDSLVKGSISDSFWEEKGMMEEEGEDISLLDQINTPTRWSDVVSQYGLFKTISDE